MSFRRKLAALIEHRGKEITVDFFAEWHPRIWGVGVHLSFEKNDRMFLVLVGPVSFGFQW